MDEKKLEEVNKQIRDIVTGTDAGRGLAESMTRAYETAKEFITIMMDMLDEESIGSHPRGSEMVMAGMVWMVADSELKLNITQLQSAAIKAGIGDDELHDAAVEMGLVSE